MAAIELRMPADIFEEMAGVREIVPVQSDTAAANVNLPSQFTPVDENRLSAASEDLFGKVGKSFEKYLQKLFEKLSDYQEKKDLEKKLAEEAIKKAKKKAAEKAIPPWILFWIKLAEFISKHLPEIFEGIRTTIITLTSIIQTVMHSFWNIMKWILKQLWSVIKWVSEKLWEFIKWLSKKIWAVVKYLFKKVGQLLKWIGKMLWKFIQMIMKGILKIAQAFWNILKRLFHVKKNKKDSAYFPNEPKGMNFAQPSISPPPLIMPPDSFEPVLPGEKETTMVIKEIQPKPLKIKNIFSASSFKKMKPDRENIVWKLTKKVLIKFAQIIGGLIKKIFQPIINKIMNSVIGTIIQFFINLVLSAWALAGAPAIAVSLTIVSWIMRGVAIITFVAGMAETVKELNDLANEGTEADIEDIQEAENESEEDDNGGLANGELSLRGWRDRMSFLEANSMKNGVTYLNAKANYMAHLIVEAEQTGNLNAAKRLRQALQLPETGNVYVFDINLKLVNDFDLDAFLEKEAEILNKKIKKYNELAEKEIIAKDELDELLLQAGGEPEWTLIVRRLIDGIKINLLPIFDRRLYIEAAVLSATAINNKPVEINYVCDYKQWESEKLLRAETLANTAITIDKWISAIEKGFSWFKSQINKESAETVKDKQPEIAIRSIFNTYGINLYNNTENYRAADEKLNKKLKERFALWVDILILLKAKLLEVS